MKLVMAYHENGGNESFEIGKRGGVHAGTEGAVGPRVHAQLHRAFGFKYRCGNSRAIFTGWGHAAMCLAADCADSAVIQEKYE